MTGRGRSQATRGKGNRRANISHRLIPDSPMPKTPPSTLSVTPPRGEYLNKNIPKDPSEKKLIHIIGPSE